MSGAEFNLKTKQELLHDIKNFYQKEVVSLLPEYEKQRGLRNLFWKIFVSFIASIILAFIHPVFLIITIVSFFLFCSKKFAKSDDCFITKFKEKLMPKFLAIFGNYKNYKSSELSHNITEKLCSLKIFPNTFVIEIDDAIIGSYKDVKISIYEVRTGYCTGTWFIALFAAISMLYILAVIAHIISGILSPIFVNVTNEVFLKVIGSLFLVLYIYILKNLYNAFIKQGLKGVLIEYTFPKKFKSKTFVYEDAYSSFDLVNKHCKNYEKVILEDSEFNKVYTVYADDQVESRYLLTTSFVERFKQINLAFSPVFQRAEFKDDKLYILIKTKKDLFEFCDLKKATTLELFNKSFEELYSVIKLIDHFKLDQKIGL